MRRGLSDFFGKNETLICSSAGDRHYRLMIRPSTQQSKHLDNADVLQGENLKNKLDMSATKGRICLSFIPYINSTSHCSQVASKHHKF